MQLNYELIGMLAEAALMIDATSVEAKYLTTTYSMIERRVWYIVRVEHDGHHDYALMGDVYNTLQNN